MEVLEHVREDPCLCKENLKKYIALPLTVLSLLLLTNTVLTITQHRGGTSVNLCHNFTLPYDIPPLVQTKRDLNATKVKFREPSSNCLPQHSLRLGEDIYLSVCTYRGSIRVDIRRFVGNVEEEGIVPTIRGIYLSPEQWKVLKTHVDFIDSSLNTLELLLV